MKNESIKPLKQQEIDDVIGMAWCDKTSFKSIYLHTGFLEKAVIQIMKKNLKRSSYLLWRKRVNGRKRKHA